MAEGAEIGVDQPWKHLRQRRTVDTELLRHVGTQVVDEHVGGPDACDQRLALGFVGEIAGDRLLAAIEGDEAGAIALDERAGPTFGRRRLLAARP